MSLFKYYKKNSLRINFLLHGNISFIKCVWWQLFKLVSTEILGDILQRNMVGLDFIKNINI